MGAEKSFFEFRIDFVLLFFLSRFDLSFFIFMVFLSFYFLFVVYGHIFFGVVVCQLGIDLSSFVCLVLDLEDSNPTGMIFDPFRERRDGSLSLGVSGLRVC